MTPIHCADCGTEAGLMLGWEGGVHEPDLAEAQVWSCPVCPDAWCRHDPVTGAAIGAPAGEKTRDARALLIERQIGRLVAEAVRDCPGAGALAVDRVSGFLATALGLERADAAVDRLGIEQCRAAWVALARASYADVVRHAQTYRGVKGRAA